PVPLRLAFGAHGLCRRPSPSSRVDRRRGMGAPVNLRAGRGRDLDAARLLAQGRAIYGEAYVPEAPPPDGECLWIEEGDAILARCSVGTAHELKGAPGTT